MLLEWPRVSCAVTPSVLRTHANGSIKRGNKDNATESVSLRTGIGVQLKDIKVFNRARQKGASRSGGVSAPPAALLSRQMPGWGREQNGPLCHRQKTHVAPRAEPLPSPGAGGSGERWKRPSGSRPSPLNSPPFPSPGTNICAQSNGGCQQLCLFRGGGQRTCACAHGMLSEDGVSCRDYDGYLLYSERTILKSIHLSDENNLNAPIKPFEDAEHMKNVIALAFDYRYGSKGSNRIFYSDIHFGNIQQINDDGTGRKTIVESECHRVPYACLCPQTPLFCCPLPPLPELPHSSPKGGFSLSQLTFFSVFKRHFAWQLSRVGM